MQCWSKFSNRGKEGYKWPASDATYNQWRPRPPSSSLCPPPLPPLYYQPRRAGVAVHDNKLFAGKPARVTKAGAGFVPCEIQTESELNDGRFLSGSIKPESASIVTLPSNMAPDLIFHTVAPEPARVKKVS